MSAILEPVQTPRIIRYYTDEEKAGALALYDRTGSLERTSETLGIPKSTIHGWLNDPNCVDSNLRIKKAADLAQKFEDAAHRFLDLANKKANKAGFNHLMTGAAIAVDKSQLLRNLPTSISLSIDREDVLSFLSESLSDVIDVTPSASESEGQLSILHSVRKCI